MPVSGLDPRGAANPRLRGECAEKTCGWTGCCCAFGPYKQLCQARALEPVEVQSIASQPSDGVRQPTGPRRKRSPAAACLEQRRGLPARLLRQGLDAMRHTASGLRHGFMRGLQPIAAHGPASGFATVCHRVGQALGVAIAIGGAGGGRRAHRRPPAPCPCCPRRKRPPPQAHDDPAPDARLGPEFDWPPQASQQMPYSVGMPRGPDTAVTERRPGADQHRPARDLADRARPALPTSEGLGNQSGAVAQGAEPCSRVQIGRIPAPCCLRVAPGTAELIFRARTPLLRRPSEPYNATHVAWLSWEVRLRLKPVRRRMTKEMDLSHHRHLLSLHGRDGVGAGASPPFLISKGMHGMQPIAAHGSASRAANS